MSKKFSFVLLLCAGCLSMCTKKNNLAAPVVIQPPAIPDTNQLLSFVDSVNSAFGVYYISLPPHYDSTGPDKFPVLIFLHGAGQMGNGKNELPYVTFDGVGKLLKEKRFPVSFTVNSQKFSFIVVEPQTSRQASSDQVRQFVEHIESIYRVDEHRIYLSGLSLGGREVTLAAAKYPQMFAAIVPIAGVAVNPGMEDRCKRIAAANLPVWVFHNVDDPIAKVADAEKFIALINGFYPQIRPRFTVFDAYGHDAWTTALDPEHREDGMNIYEWMLRYSR